MLHHDDALVRKLMMTPNRMRYRRGSVQLKAMEVWNDEASRTRGAFQLEFRTGKTRGSRRLICGNSWMPTGAKSEYDTSVTFVRIADPGKENSH
jgi:hypothetical protein